MQHLKLWHRSVSFACALLTAFCCVLGLISAPIPAAAADGQQVIYLNATAGSDSNDGSTADTAVATYAKAKELANAAVSSGSSVVIEASSFDVAAGIEIPASVTLLVTEDVTLDGTNAGNLTGIKVLNGGHLKVAAGKTLSFTGFNTNGAYALNVAAGGEVNDGKYSFDGLKWAYYLDGSFKGSSREALIVNVNASDLGIEWTDKAQHTNATITATAVPTGDKTNSYYGHSKQFNVTNSSITFKGIAINAQSELGLQFKDSTVSVEGQFYSNWRAGYRTLAITYNTASVLDNSTLIVRGGFFSVTTGGGLTLRNGSEVRFQADSAGNYASACLNVNYNSWVRVEDSTLSSEINAPLAGEWNDANHLYFSGNSVVNTLSNSNSTAIAMVNKGSTYEVTGGSYLLYPNLSDNRAIPTNGAAHGNEKLGYFQLKDASVTSLTPYDSNGEPYTYPVARASQDGNKYVWVPKVSVQFYRDEQSLNASETPLSTRYTMRGASLSQFSKYRGQANDIPATPTAAAKTFVGWFYKDGETETAFTDKTVLMADTKVYGKWENDPTAAYVSYAVNLGGSEQYFDGFKRVEGDTQTATVLDPSALEASEPAFSQPKMKFDSWNTKADGTGTSYKPGDTISFTGQGIDLYAIWNDVPLVVTFSANGGTFATDSVFKQYSDSEESNPTKEDGTRNPIVFKIVQDDRGGEAAVLTYSEATLRNPMGVNQMLYNASNGALNAYNTPGIVNDVDKSDDPSSNYQIAKHLATKPHQQLQDVETKFLIFTSSHFWFTSATKQDASTVADYPSTLSGNVTYYLKWVDDPAIEQVSGTATMDADMWTVSAARSSQVRSVRANEPFSVTGAIDTSAIERQLADFRAQYYDNGGDGSDITLDTMSSTFTATLTLPEGVTLNGNLQSSAVARGYESLFQAPTYTQNGNVITVVFKLKDGISTYADLERAVQDTGVNSPISAAARMVRSRLLRATGATSSPSLPDSSRIEVSIPNLEVTDASAQNDKLYTLTGTLDGNFEAYATFNGITKHFKLAWNGTQLAGNQDAGSNGPLAASVRTAVPIAHQLVGDLLLDNSTQNVENTPEYVYRNNAFTAQGKLNVAPIRDQIKAMALPYDSTEGINIDLYETTFTATLTLPDQVVIPQGLKAVASNMGGLFEVIDTQVNGQVVTVTMKLQGRNEDGTGPYTTFDSLNEAVQKAGDKDGWIVLDLPGLTIKPSTPFGERFAMTGTVEGNFWATAHKTTNGTTTSHEYAFTWSTTQWEEGSDKLAEDPSTISLTMELKAREIQRTVRWIDAETGEELNASEVTTLTEGDPYSTESKEIEGYTLVEVPNNASGTVPGEDFTVTYEYRKNTSPTTPSNEPGTKPTPSNQGKTASAHPVPSTADLSSAAGIGVALVAGLVLIAVSRRFEH